MGPDQLDVFCFVYQELMAPVRRSRPTPQDNTAPADNGEAMMAMARALQAQAEATNQILAHVANRNGNGD